MVHNTDPNSTVSSVEQILLIVYILKHQDHDYDTKISILFLGRNYTRIDSTEDPEY